MSNLSQGLGELPFNTGNAALAFCLYIAGIPFQDESQPLTNIYDAEMLRRMGYTNTPVEEAVQLAFAAHKKGHIEFGFKRALRIGEALEGYKGAETALESSDESGEHLVGETIKNHVAGILSLAEALSMASCITLKRWRGELKLWEQRKKFTLQRNKNEVQSHDARELAEKVFLLGEPLAFMAVIMDARAVFLKLPERYPPVIRLRRIGNVQTSVLQTGKKQKGKIAKHPGFAFFTPETENGVRKHLGIPQK